MSEEWGPWIEHDGRSCPCVGLVVRVVAANGRDEIGLVDILASQVSDRFASMWIWSSIPAHWWGHRIIRYRVRKPRGLVICENLLADLPEKVDA
jgi:hypothetical protein